jgi:hypothetical protein
MPLINILLLGISKKIIGQKQKRRLFIPLVFIIPKVPFYRDFRDDRD